MKILHLEDDPADTERVASALTAAGLNAEIVRVQTRAEFEAALRDPQAETLTGWPLAEALGQPIERVFVIVDEATRQPVRSPVARVLREGKTAGLDNHTVLNRRDGSDLPIDDSSAPIFDQDGRLIGVVLTFRDVSQRRAAQ